jgi:hypothetical protein
MTYEWHVFREYGVRYWLAWHLVRIAHRVKDTTFHQVIRIADGSAVMIEADTWGAGVTSAYGVCTDVQDADGWPELRDFDDFDEALDWMHEGHNV